MIRMVSHRPDVMTLDRPGEHWRPGVIWSLNGASATIKVFLHNSDQRHEYTVPTSSLPSNAIGSPIVVKFTSEAYSPIADLQAGEWSGDNPGPGTGEQDAVARGLGMAGSIARRQPVLRVDRRT